MNNELFIDGISVDLPADSVIALSYAVNTLYEMKTVQGIVSNRIVLPPTSRNLAACGFPDDLNIDFKTSVRRRKQCRYLQNTVEIIPAGYVEINGADAKGISVFITAGNVDFFELVTGSIRDLDLREYDHLFNIRDVELSRLKTEGYIYPVIQYGQIRGDHTGVNVHGMRPATFVKTLLEKIVAETGYTLENGLENMPVYNTMYQKLILPFSLDSFSHSDRYLNQFSNESVVVLHRHSYRYENRGGEHLRWDYKERDESNLFSLSEGTYTAKRSITVRIKADFPNIHTAKTWITSGDAGGYLRLEFNEGRPDYRQLAYFDLTFPRGESSMDYPNVVMSAEVELKAGDTIAMRIRANRGGSPAEVDVVISDARMVIEETGSKVLYGQPVQLEATLPDIAKKDFLKSIAALFCALIHTDNRRKTVAIVPFKKLKDNLPYALDWSDKISNEHPINSLSIGEYGRSNFAKYKKDDTVTPENYGNAVLTISDENLQKENTLFELPFAASKETSVLDGFRTIEILKTRIEDAAPIPEYATRTEPRIALLNKQDATVNYNVSEDNNAGQNIAVYGSIPFALFETVSGNETSLLMSSVLEKFYPDFKILLNDQRRIVVKAQITEVDIAQLDFFKPIYLMKFGAYFYLSKISDYVGDNKLSKLEVIKLY